MAIHKGEKISFLSERAEGILGVKTPGGLIGRPFFDLIHPDSRRDMEDRIRAMSRDPSLPVPVLREKLLRADGTPVTVDVMAINITDDGVPATQVMFREVNG